MDALTAAITKPLQSLSFATKMTVIGALFLIPIVLLLAVSFLQLNSDRTFYSSEQVGVAYTKALRPLFADLEAYRLSDAATKAATASRIDADFATLAGFDQTGGKKLELTAALGAIQTKWQQHAAVDAILSDFIALLGSVSDNSKITLDPILDGYYVGDTMVNKGPSLIDGVAQAAVLGVAAIRSGKLSTDDRITAAELSGQITTARDGIEHNVPIATTAAPYLTIGTTTQPAEKGTATAFAAWLDGALLKPATPSGRAAALTVVQVNAIGAAFALYDSSIAGMDDVLRHRLNALAARTFAIFAAVLAVIFITGVIMFAITRSMSAQLASVTKAVQLIVTEDIAMLTKTLRRLAAGDLTGRMKSERPQLPVSGADEIGILVTTYNSLAAALNDMSSEYALASSELHGLLSCLAITSKALGTASADTSTAAQQSTGAVVDIATAVDLVAGGALDQSAQIADTATAVEELSRTAQQIAEVAADQANSISASMLALAGLNDEIGALAREGDALNTSARDASTEARAGTAAVTETAAKMSGLRADSLNAAAAMSALEERSTQVGEIVDTIEDIADQTNLLALNAAIEAARAGDAGRGFAVVADEVRKLADRSRTATKDISQILDAMKRDTHVAAETMRASVASMNSSIETSERAARSLETLNAAIGTTTAVAESLNARAQEMRAASIRVTEHMTSTSAAVEENAAAAAEMRSTTDHVTNVIVPIAATASANARTAQSAAASTQELAMGIGDIETTARQLRERSIELESLLQRFTVDENIQVRKFLRVREAFDLRYTVAGKAEADGRSRDLGGGGACFESHEALALGTALKVCFKLPNGPAIEALARVVDGHFDETNATNVHHIAFSSISDAAVEAITAHIYDARKAILMAHG